MIFVAVGTHPEGFERLIKRIDEIAPKIKEEIIIQRGFTKYIPKNCKSFDFTSNIDDYYKKARLAIIQSATSILEYSLKYRKPVITVPRQKRFHEHINNHQVEFGEYFAKKTGIKCVININDITPELLKDYKIIPKINLNGIKKLQNYFSDLLSAPNIRGQPPKPFAYNRMDYLINLIEPKKTDKILNIGISNIPEIEEKIESKVKECWTVDFDEKKLKKASVFLKRTKLVQADITKSNSIPKNYFDTVVIIEVLEHLKEDKKALEWINSILKKGGKIVVGVPNDAFLHYFNPVKYAEHERHYSNELIKQRLKDTGFKINHFNLVENYTLLLNLYIHLLFKFVLRIQRPFGTFKKSADKSYKQHNPQGMDIILRAIKI